MKTILIILSILLVGISPVYANQNIKYCYNCDYHKTIVKRYYNNPVVVAPMEAPIIAPSPGIFMEGPIVYPAAPMNCAWYPDPYTFLGEIFGYDYIQVCQ